MDYTDKGRCFNSLLKLMDACDDSLDLIVLPEYCDIPVNTPGEKEFNRIAPGIRMCIGWNGEKDDNLAMIRRALTVGSQKVQLFKPYFDQSSVDYAHANGIYCNVFYADDPLEAIRYADMGIDCILTNDYLRVSQAVRKHLSINKQKG